MHAATKLHDLLLAFRDETGAQRCSVVSSDFGTRVEVGRPATLSADELDWGARSSDTGASRGDQFRTMSAETGGYSIVAEFETVKAADEARSRFGELVRAVTALVSEMS
jgi:hypothetical protein